MPSSAHEDSASAPHKTPATSEEGREHVEHLDQADFDQANASHSAESREEAVEVIADPNVDAEVRQAVAERLEQADNRMTLGNVDPEDSY
jgi:hypothetical protein